MTWDGRRKILRLHGGPLTNDMGRSKKDGFPLPVTGAGLRGGTGIGPRIREDNGWGWILASVFTGTGAGGRGWVPASARTTRTTGGGGFPLPSSRGQAFCGGTGMGPRIREDNGGGWIPAPVFTGGRLPAGGRGWVPASARTTGGGGFPLPSSRGQAFCGGTGGRGDDGWAREGLNSSPTRRDGRRMTRGGKGGSRTAPTERQEGWGGRGWVPASARTMGGGGFPLPSSLGQALCGKTGMGPRIREDNGWGWIPASVFTGAGSPRGDGDGSPHPRGQWVGVGMTRRGALG